jgi:transcriptional regulator with XRE-family HTH domain
MASKQEIGRRIRQAREEAGMTQGELGRQWGGRSHAAISDIERGATSVTASGLAEFAAILGKSVGYFYGERTAAEFLRGGRDETGTVVAGSAAEDFKKFLREKRKSSD